MFWRLIGFWLIAGCGLAAAIDQANDDLNEANKKEQEFKQELARQYDYAVCWRQEYDACVLQAAETLTVCSPNQFRTLLDDCEKAATQYCLRNKEND